MPEATRTAGERQTGAVGERQPGVAGAVGERLPGVGRIAVLRANALGDFVFALPALAALRAAYPDGGVVLLGAPWHAKLLARPARPGGPGAGGPAGPRHPRPRPRRTRPSRRCGASSADAAREGFDLAMQLHGGGRNSNPIVTALGARLTAGLRAEDAPPLDRWLRYVYYQPEVFRYLEVVGAGRRAGHHRPAVADGHRRRPGTGDRGARRADPAPGGAAPGGHRHPAALAGRALRRGRPGAAGDGYEVLVTGTPADRRWSTG